MNWLDRIGAELEKSEPPDEMDWVLTRSDSPQFLKNAERQLLNCIAPSLKWKRGDSLTAVRLGALLGHKIAYVKPFAEGLRVSRLYESKVAPEFIKGLKEVEERMLDYYPVVMRTARRCIAIALQQTLGDARQFLSGMTKALEKGSVDAGGRMIGATLASEFYWVLLFIGPRLQYDVRSVGHLHQLCRRWFGQRAGDLKTTEKRCQRIGLTFGRRGRPKKQ